MMIPGKETATVYEERNDLRIEKEEQDYTARMSKARARVYRALSEVEHDMNLSVADMLRLLSSMQNIFVDALLEVEKKERWEEARKREREL